jgi:fructose-specific PTS system IIB-like component
MKFLAVTACPSGVAHTYMAAEAIANAAKKKGIDIKVETQGSIGIENKITTDDLKDADAVILTKDMPLKDVDRFKGITTVKVGVGDCIKKADAIISKVEVYVKNKK